MQLRSLKQADLKGKRVLLLVDYDVPASDDTRIRLTIPTIEYLRQQDAKIIILTKRGRPDGHIVENLRTDLVSQKLQKLLNRPVTKINTTIGREAESAVADLNEKQILMLENSRFLAGEGKNDPKTAAAMSRLADLVVNDQFSIAHRAEASRSAIAKFLPVYAGLNLLLEVKMLGKLIANPQRPFVAIIGGAKISDKLPAIQNLSKIADIVLVGGGVANNFLKAAGVDIAKSYQDENYIRLAKDLMNHHQIQHPFDVIAATSPKSSQTCTLNVVDPQKSTCPDDNLMFLDIGPDTIKLYTTVIAKAKTIFWNGPMGVFEQPDFATGTKTIAQAVAANKSAVTIVGGGDTIAAINKFKLAKQYDYVSAAGGAALDFLGGKKLPGLLPMMIK